MRREEAMAVEAEHLKEQLSRARGERPKRPPGGEGGEDGEEEGDVNAYAYGKSANLMRGLHGTITMEIESLVGGRGHWSGLPRRCCGVGAPLRPSRGTHEALLGCPLETLLGYSHEALLGSQG